eukprot:9501390-Pyramimonas_sp.AAC.1
MGASGVARSQGFKRLPKRQTWLSDDWAQLKGVPREVCPGVEHAGPRGPLRLSARRQEGRDAAVRMRYALKRDIEMHEGTLGFDVRGICEFGAFARVPRPHRGGAHEG